MKYYRSKRSTKIPGGWDEITDDWGKHNPSLIKCPLAVQKFLDTEAEIEKTIKRTWSKAHSPAEQLYLSFACFDWLCGVVDTEPFLAALAPMILMIIVHDIGQAFQSPSSLIKSDDPKRYVLLYISVLQYTYGSAVGSTIGLLSCGFIFMPAI